MQDNSDVHHGIRHEAKFLTGHGICLNSLVTRLVYFGPLEIGNNELSFKTMLINLDTDCGMNLSTIYQTLIP